MSKKKRKFPARVEDEDLNALASALVEEYGSERDAIKANIQFMVNLYCLIELAIMNNLHPDPAKIQKVILDFITNEQTQNNDLKPAIRLPKDAKKT